MKKRYFFTIALFVFNFNAIAQPGTFNNEFSQDGWDASIYGNNGKIYFMPSRRF